MRRIHRWTGLAAIAFAGAAACTPRSSVTDGSLAADSLSLERTRCFGSCPVYRLVARADGAVRFESRGPRDSGRVAEDRIPVDSVAALVAAAERFGLASPPDSIVPGNPRCTLVATDHPSMTVTLYRGASSEGTHLYLGCHDEPLRPLAAFGARIDSVTRSWRWTGAPAPASGSRIGG